MDPTANEQARIFAAIDAMQLRGANVSSYEVAAEIGDEWFESRLARVVRTLRSMSKAGTVVYDRKASGWRRA